MELNQEEKQSGQQGTNSSKASCADTTGEQKAAMENKKTEPTDNHELLSDGSASAFEGTEFRDNLDREQELNSSEKKKSDYPSGLSDY